MVSFQVLPVPGSGASCCEDIFRCSNGWNKAPIYGKQKTSNGQRDQGDAQARLGLILGNDV
ncbi:hypothetical protein IFM47457_00945 [Aspergillus lentulus]|nr:hypothetical protein IFM47457_00945 [Aspergillus lentulus]